MNSDPYAVQVLDVRAQCPKCGRFVSWDAIESEDYFDPGAYYGVGSNEWTNCKKCGRIDGVSVATTRVGPIPEGEAR